MAINRDKVLRTAEKLVQRGKIEQAIREYEKLLKVNPNDANTINRVGDLYGRIGRLEEAIALYERIAEYFTADGFASKAIAILKKINRLAPQRVDIFERLAELYLQQNLVVEARNQFEILAKWFEKNDDVENAIRIQRKLLELDPSNYPVRLHLADALMRTGEHEEALAEYGRLGKLLLDRDKLDEAERLYHHVLDLKPPTGDFLEPPVEALVDAGRLGEARKLLDRGLALSPAHPGLRGLQARILLASGEAREAFSIAEDLLSSDPENDDLRALVGGAALGIGKGDRAREVLLPAIDGYLRDGRVRPAKEILESLREAEPENLEVLSRACKVYELSGDTGLAVEVKQDLADRFFEQGEREQAYRLYLELSQAKPSDQLIRQRLAQLSEDLGELPAAPTIDAGGSRALEVEAGAVRSTPETVAEFPPTDRKEDDTRTDIGERAVSIPEGVSPADFDPDERLAEARVFAKYSLEDKAIRHLEEILVHFPANTEARETLVEILVAQGKEEYARQVAEPLLQQYERADEEAKRAALLRSLGLGEEAVPVSEPVVPAEVEEEEDVLIIDFEEGTDTEVTPAPASAFPSGIVEEVSFEDVAPASSPASAPTADSNVFSELEALEKSLLASPDSAATAPKSGIEGAKEPAPQPGAMPGAQEIAEPDLPSWDAEDSGAGGDLVDISESVEGPPVDALEQIDFFVEQKLYEDALRVLSDLEMDYPGDAELAQRRLVLKAKGVIIEEAVLDQGEEAGDLFSEEEEYIDLARELEAELAEEEALVEEATGQGKDEALLDEVFKEFQRGVSEQLSEEDSDTHFNLGIAYKEMGLLSEAIGEFQIAAKDPSFLLECCSMIGVCYVEQGMFPEAASWYERALEIEDLPDGSKLALTYDLAGALEASGDDMRAVDLYSKVAEVDPKYREVGARLQGLQRQHNVN